MDQLPGPSGRDFSEGEWVRLRTLTTLRWMAVVGQIVVLVAANAWFGLIVPVGPCALAIGAAMALNIVCATVFPGNRRLADHEAMLLLLFDLVQLVYLVGMTGGLDNPFILLVIVPVTISAAALELKSTVFLGGLAVQLVTAVAFVFKP